MSIGGSTHPHSLYSIRGGRQIAAPTDTLVGSTVQTHGLYLKRCLAMNHRRYFGFHIWGDTIYPHKLYSQRGGRLIAAPTGVTPFNHTGYIGDVPGTAHRPFPTVSLVGAFLNQRIPKQDTFVTNNCQLSILPPFPTVLLAGVLFEPRCSEDGCFGYKLFFCAIAVIPPASLLHSL